MPCAAPWPLAFTFQLLDRSAPTGKLCSIRLRISPPLTTRCRRWLASRVNSRPSSLPPEPSRLTAQFQALPSTVRLGRKVSDSGVLPGAERVLELLLVLPSQLTL